jgi:hypothetical protein
MTYCLGCMRHRRREVELDSRDADNRTNTRLTAHTESVGNNAQEHAEGRRIRQSIALWLADVLSDPSSPLTTEQMGHYRMITNWFPDGQQALDRIERIYRKDRPEICDELYISLIVACVDKILSDTRPKTVTGVVKNSTKKQAPRSAVERLWESREKNA